MNKHLSYLLLTTQRLILCPLTKSDLQDFFQLASDLQLTKSIGWPAVHHLEDAERLLNEFIREQTSFAITLKESHITVGTIHLDELPPALKHHPALSYKRGVTLSFAVHPDYQRQGIITEALTSLIDTLFHQAHYDFINCGYYDFNEPSKKLQEKLGFEFLLVHQIVINDQTVDVLENILWNHKSQ